MTGFGGRFRCTCLAAGKSIVLHTSSDARVLALGTMYLGCIFGGDDSSCFLWILHDFTLLLSLQKLHSYTAAAMGTWVTLTTSAFVFHSQQLFSLPSLLDLEDAHMQQGKRLHFVTVLSMVNPANWDGSGHPTHFSQSRVFVMATCNLFQFLCSLSCNWGFVPAVAGGNFGIFPSMIVLVSLGLLLFFNCPIGASVYRSFLVLPE